MGRLKGRVTALQEEKEVMQTALNALNVDLLERPEAEQQLAAEAAAAASDLPQPSTSDAAREKANAGLQRRTAKRPGFSMAC